MSDDLETQFRFLLRKIVEHEVDDTPDPDFDTILRNALNSVDVQRRRYFYVRATSDQDVIDIVREVFATRPRLWYQIKPEERRQGGLHRMVALTGDVTE